MYVRDILKIKGADVVSVGLREAIHDLARLLDQKRIGLAVVCDDGGRVVGVISERDIVRGVAEHGTAVCSMRVEDLMTRDAVTCNLEDVAKDVIDVMKESRVRHLPVVENSALRGLVSVGDVLKYLWQEAQLDEEALRNYIGGVGYR